MTTEPYDAERLQKLINGTTGLSTAAVNVERTRMSGLAAHLAGWEHNTIREAITALAAQAEEIERLRGEIEQFAREVEAGSIYMTDSVLNQNLCCNGHMCGCRGSSVGQYLAHLLREILTPEVAALGGKQDD